MQGTETIMAVGLAEAARRLGVSTRTVATLVAKDELYSRQIGRRRVIPIRALESFLHQTRVERREKSNAD